MHMTRFITSNFDYSLAAGERFDSILLWGGKLFGTLATLRFSIEWITQSSRVNSSGILIPPWCMCYPCGTGGTPNGQLEPNSRTLVNVCLDVAVGLYTRRRPRAQASGRQICMYFLCLLGFVSSAYPYNLFRFSVQYLTFSRVWLKQCICIRDVGRFNRKINETFDYIFRID